MANKTQRVREKIAKELHETHKKNCVRMFTWGMADTAWEDLSGHARRHCRSAANQILKIKGLRIEADNQAPPAINWSSDDLLYDIAFMRGIAARRDSLVKAGWRKVI